jgi:hypothetical protein
MLRLFPTRALQQLAVPVRSPEGAPSSKGQLRVWGWVQVCFRRGRRDRTTGDWGTEQETKSAERTASASESTFPPGPPPLPAPAIPQGAVWAAEEEAQAFPCPHAPAPTLHLLTPPPDTQCQPPRESPEASPSPWGTPLVTPSKQPPPHCPHLCLPPHCGEYSHEFRCRSTFQLHLTGGCC